MQTKPEQSALESAHLFPGPRLDNRGPEDVTTQAIKCVDWETASGHSEYYQQG